MKINFASKANEKYVLRSKKDPSLFLSSHIIKYRNDYDDDNHHKREYKAQNQKSLKQFLKKQEERKKDDNYLVLDIPYQKNRWPKDYFKGTYYYHLFSLTKDPENALCYNSNNISIDLMNLIKNYAYNHDLEQFKDFKDAVQSGKYNQYSLIAFQSTDFFKFIDENFHFVKPVVSISYDGEPEHDASAILMANCFNVTSDKEKQYK